MGDVIRLEKGLPPWQPATDARLVKEYAYYEIPLAGVVEQHGVRYYFKCLTGDDAQVNVWLYMRLSAEDEARLDESTAEDFTRAVEFNGPGMLALALEGLGLVAFDLMDPLSEAEVERGYNALVRKLERLVERAKELAPT